MVVISSSDEQEMSLPAKSALKNVPRSAADDTMAPAVQALVTIEVYG